MKLFAICGPVINKSVNNLKAFPIELIKADEFLQKIPELLEKIVLVDRNFLQNSKLVEISRQYPEIAFVLVAEKSELTSLLSDNDFYFLDIILDQELESSLSQILQRITAGYEEIRSNALFRVIKEFQQMGIISGCSVMAEIFLQVKKVAQSNSTVLLIGESGTGKELIARSIHYFSKRREFNFVAVNTGAIPENLLEDELFGHVKGAFTSALKDRKGKFEHAHRGTIFLDEISTMSPALQVKLLRVLQEREIERVGDNQPIKVDVRIISATNQDLEKLVRENQFRQDLYYRLNVIPIRLPPLRSRSKDIPLLANFFVKKYCQLNEFAYKTISLDALRLLQGYHWPGNVRQLENIIERAVVLNPEKEVLSVAEFSSELGINEHLTGIADVSATEIDFPEEGLYLNEILQKIERQLILKSLEKARYNKQKAAQLLGIKRTTLIEKMKKIQP